jgi:ribonucleoside-diphosphate reductase beta chain
VIRAEEPELFDAEFSDRVTEMIGDAVDVEAAFAADVLAEGVSGLSLANIRQYLEYVADQRLVRLGMPKRFGSRNPLDFMMLQDVAEHTNFFERTVSAYQVGVEGDVSFDESF